MSKIDFPNNPTTGEIYEYAGQKWRWDGKSWNSVSSSNLSSIDITEYQLKDQIQGTVIGDLVPLGNATVDLGSLNKKFKSLYLDSNSLFLGNSTISESNGDILLDPNNSGSSVKLNVSDISELSDNNNLLSSGSNSGVDLDQVDDHLNLDSAGEGQVLSYTGGDYRWIDSVAGPAGADGQDGADGAGITNVVDNGNGTLTISYGDGSAVTTSNLTGPQGPAGTNGTNGTDGQDGADGDVGPQGPPGADGANGGSLVTLTVPNSEETGSSLVLVGLGSDANQDLSSHITFTSGSSITINSMPADFHLLGLTYFRSELANSSNFEIIYPTNLIKSGLHEPLYWNSYRLDSHFDVSTATMWEYWKKNSGINDSWSIVPNDANVDTMKGSVSGLASAGKYKFHLKFN